MREPRPETMEDRVETLRSVQSLPRTAAGAVVLVQAPQLLALEGAEVASGQKGRRPVLRERTALVAGALVLQQQV